jgi:hypothetical protein
MKSICIGALLLLTACGGPIKVNVYGASGKAYTAPDVCAALIACKNSTETACYYESTIIVNVDGSRMESGCKAVTK